MLNAPIMVFNYQKQNFHKSKKKKKWFRNSTQKKIIFPFYAKPWPNPPKKIPLKET